MLKKFVSLNLALRCWLPILSSMVLAMPLRAASPWRILVVGDSISVGYTDNPVWSVPYEFGFRSGLYTRLTNGGMSVQFVGDSPEPWNGRFGVPTNSQSLDLRKLGQDHCEGYGGKRTAFMLEHIDEWLTRYSPDIVLLMAGINDIRPGTTAEPIASEQNLSNTVATVVRRSPDAHLVVAQITPRSEYSVGIVKYNDYIRNKLVPHFAGVGKRVTTVDQYANLLVPGTTNIDRALFANGINHPLNIVYQRMAETWFQGIQTLKLPKAKPAPAEPAAVNP